MSENEDDQKQNEDGLVPLTVAYCSVCSMPHEYCADGLDPERCFKKLKEENEQLFKQLHGDLSLEDALAQLSLKGKRGGKGVYKLDDDDQGGKQDGASSSTSSSSTTTTATAGASSGGKKITITRFSRGGRKFVTQIQGLDAHVELATAKKALAQKYASGTGIVKLADGEPAIEIQGDIQATVPQFLQKKFKIDPKLCSYVDKVKKKK